MWHCETLSLPYHFDIWLFSFLSPKIFSDSVLGLQALFSLIESVFILRFVLNSLTLTTAGR